MATLESSIQLNDQMSSVLLGIIDTVNSTVDVVGRMNSALAADADTSSFEAMSGSIENVREQISGLAETEMPAPQWQSDTSIEVFNTSGVERYRQEIGSLTGMMSQLSAAQESITQNAIYGNVLPPNAAADMINLNNRIGVLQQRIQRINSNPANAVNPAASAEAERLRGQLNDMLQTQQRMNAAVENMDVSAANQEYLRLSGNVSNTERYIRDNVNEQGRFNSTVEQGNGAVDKLKGYIKKALGAYAGFKGVEKLVEMSDSLVTAKARLDMMSNGKGDEVYEKIYQAAQRARGSLDGMTDVVARFGNNAKDAFSVDGEIDTEQVVAFSELVQKQMTIAGASTQESQNAMLQLSQALGSGVLRGDELNSIFEQAPNLIQGIADYLDVPIGKIREMASEGEITADIVKNSVFAAADDINAKFNDMPMTWGQMWQSMKNQATVALEPVLEKLNEMFNDEQFQAGLTAIMDGFAAFAAVALDVLTVIGDVASWVADNWSVIAPIVMTAAAAILVYSVALGIMKIQQNLANIAMRNMPMSSIIKGFAIAVGIMAAFVGIMAAVRAIIEKVTGVSFSLAGLIGGVLMVIFAACGNLIIDIVNIFITLGNVGMGVWEVLCSVASNIVAAFTNAFLTLQSWFYGFLETFWNVIDAVVEGINKIPFVNIDTTGIKANAQHYADKKAEAEGKKVDYEDVGAAWNKGFNSLNYLDRIDYNDAFELGYGLGDKLSKSFNQGSEIDDALNEQVNYEDMMSDVNNISDNTDDIKNGLEITDEELEYLRDIAEQEAVNRFTTAEINIEQTNNNSVSSAMDLDGIVSNLTDMAAEAVEIISEGVHA